MTLTELKSLKVGQVVKYTNDVDPLNIGYWIVQSVYGDYIELKSISSGGYHTFNTTEEDIDLIASMLTIDQPIAYKALEPQRQLKLIEAKIRDAEFDVRTVMRETEFMYKMHGTMSGLMQEEIVKKHEVLTNLRHQRNELIEKI